MVLVQTLAFGFFLLGCIFSVRFLLDHTSSYLRSNTPLWAAIGFFGVAVMLATGAAESESSAVTYVVYSTPDARYEYMYDEEMSSYSIPDRYLTRDNMSLVQYLNSREEFDGTLQEFFEAQLLPLKP